MTGYAIDVHLGYLAQPRTPAILPGVSRTFQSGWYPCACGCMKYFYRGVENPRQKFLNTTHRTRAERRRQK